MLAMLMLAMVQTVPGPPGDEDLAPRRVTSQRRCVRKTDEIVVCAGGAESDRLLPLPEPGTRVIFKPAAMQIAPNKRVTLHAQSSSNPTVAAPRGMVDLTIKF